MENKRAILISLICFAVAIVLISAYARVRRREMTYEFGEEVPVVVARVDIPEYGLIRADMLEVRQVFKTFRQPNTVVDVDDISGKSAFVPIYAREQVTLTKLVSQDGKPVLDRQVEKKMRAVTIGISPHTGVGRLIRPGNHIDILTTPNYDFEGQTIFEVKTLIQNALVLATGKNIQNQVPTRVNRDVLNYIEEQAETARRKDILGSNMESLATGRPDDGYSSITVQLSPEDAEKILLLGTTFGDQRLYFTLRNGADQALEKTDTTLLDEVLGPESDYGFSKRKPPPPPPPKAPRFIDNRGGAPVEVQ
jgi:Flp pilus assembly protein CpaB